MLKRLTNPLGILTMIAGLGGTLAIATPAEASFTVCNKDTMKAFVSIAYYSRSPDTFISEGWWHVDPGKCATVIAGELKNKYYFVYGHDGKNGEWAGSKQFCVSSEEYTLADADKKCTGKDERWEKFIPVDTGDAPNFTFNLRP